ncbi:ribonuclease H-like [Chanodichthys erythropterus]|uniref:ribonuclease H-like n=1 Tax=Chanodichthys erythropterus TaxID=933992 RepID=UPI00351DAABA
MPTAYVDGRSYNHEGILQASAGARWLNNQPCQPQNSRWGPQSCQYGEAAATLKTFQVSSVHNIRELMCTDSHFARPCFTCHLLGWKQTGFKTECNKQVKHQHMFQTHDHLTQAHDMIVYWEKV